MKWHTGMIVAILMSTCISAMAKDAKSRKASQLSKAPPGIEAREWQRAVKAAETKILRSTMQVSQKEREKHARNEHKIRLRGFDSNIHASGQISSANRPVSELWPKITYIFPEYGRYNDLVVIEGARFSEDWLVCFKVDNEVIKVAPDDVNENQIFVYVPYFDGIARTKTASVWLEKKLKIVIPTKLGSKRRIQGSKRDEITKSNEYAYLINPKRVHMLLSMTKVAWEDDATITHPLTTLDGFQFFADQDEQHQYAEMVAVMEARAASHFGEDQDINDLAQQALDIAEAMEARLSMYLVGLTSYAVSHGYNDPRAHIDLQPEGTDLWWKTFRLKNSWKVSNVWVEELVKSRSGEGSRLSIALSGRNTNSPYVEVDWKLGTGGTHLAYIITIEIYGPLGVPY